MPLIRSTAAVLLLCAACGGGDDPQSSAKNDSAPLPAVEHGEDEPHDASAAADTALKVTFHGIGPLRVGMTEEDARRALGHFRRLTPAPADSLACDFARSVRLPPGVLVMLEGARVVRVQVDSGAVSTAEGARIGDTEARIQQLYPGRVKIEPHKYTDGHYLVVRPTEPADTTHLLVFETDGRVVERFRAGQRPQVEWVEGCS